jgi:hypothetical protein
LRLRDQAFRSFGFPPQNLWVSKGKDHPRAGSESQNEASDSSSISRLAVIARIGTEGQTSYGLCDLRT